MLDILFEDILGKGRKQSKREKFANTSISDSYKIEACMKGGWYEIGASNGYNKFVFSCSVGAKD